jgi:hypothetical protein
VARQTLLAVWWSLPNGRLGYAEFAKPELLSLASEGFCPYKDHGEHDIGPVRLEQLPDGRVRCPSSGTVMLFLWTTEEMPGLAPAATHFQPRE